MFEEQIDNLIKNIPETREPITLDIVLEGGGFNGSYEIGVMYFIRELEKHKYVNVNRISGASIGSIVGLCYITNNLDLYIEKYELLREKWKEEVNLNLINDLIDELCDNLEEDIFAKLRENKLFVTYYCLNTKEQVIQSNYENIEELKGSIKKSCYLPYIVDNDIGICCREQYFIDGGHPFIFHNREKSLTNKILYVSINQLSTFKNMISTKNEKNTYGRVLTGVLDCYKFFIDNRRTKLCSYVNDWSLLDYIYIYIKEFFIIAVIYIIHYVYLGLSKVNPYIENRDLYKRVIPLFRNMYRDIVLYMCF